MTFRIACSESAGFTAYRFETKEKAQAWIDAFNKRKEKIPGLCSGEHTVVELKEE